MIEATGEEVDEESILGAVKFGIENGKEVIGLIEKFTQDAGQAKQDYQSDAGANNHVKEIKQFIKNSLIGDLENPKVPKMRIGLKIRLLGLKKNFCLSGKVKLQPNTFQIFWMKRLPIS